MIFKCFSTRRKGFVLPAVLSVSIFLFVLSGSVFVIANMNTGMLSLFEQRSILEQATVSFGKSLTEKLLQEREDATWNTDVPVTGVLNLNSAQGIGGVPAMLMSYTVRQIKTAPKQWSVCVTGEYTARDPRGAKIDPAEWGISIDILPGRAQVVEYEKPRRIR